MIIWINIVDYLLLELSENAVILHIMTCEIERS